MLDAQQKQNGVYDWVAAFHIWASGIRPNPTVYRIRPNPEPIWATVSTLNPKSPQIVQNRPKSPKIVPICPNFWSLWIHRTPLSYIFDTRSVGFLDSRLDTKCVPVRVFSDHKLIRFLDCQVSQKVVREQLGASALRATCGVLRDELRVGGRSAPSPGLLRGGVGSSSRLQYQRLAVAAALRTLLVVPTSRNSPLKMGPRGTREALAVRRW